MFAVKAHQEQVLGVAAALDRCRLKAGGEHACSYLPGRPARYVAFRVDTPFQGLYHALMDLNFRRSGLTFYRPECEGCHECRAIRVPVAAFSASRAQKRCWARNTDLDVTMARPEPSDEKHALYQSYLCGRHNGQMDGSREEFREFLYVSGVETLEICYRYRGRLLGVAIADVEPEAMSAVYCYFDPAERGRSLGVYNVLWLMDACRRAGRSYLYLGYWVADGHKMSYKARYRPHQILCGPGEWASGSRDVGE